MTTVPDESVHLVVTSPPYWCIKDYGHHDQIGFNQSYEEYLDAMIQVFAECYRALYPGCKMAVNVGDQYLSAAAHGRHRVQPISAHLTANGVELGFDFMGSIIWRKIPNSNPSGGGTLMGSLYYPRDGAMAFEHEYILLFRKPGKAPKPSPEAKEKSRLTREERTQWFRGVWDDVHPAKQHPLTAPFPVEIPRRLIKMFSFYGETVLDPFVGSGTTTVAAMMEGRCSIGYEINQALEPTIRERLQQGFLPTSV